MSNELKDSVTTTNEVVSQAENEVTHNEENTEALESSTPTQENVEAEVVSADQVEENPEEQPIDYPTLSKDEMVQISQTLISEETDFRKIDEILRNLKLEFDGRNQKLQEEALQKFIESGGDAADFKFTQDDQTDKFYENYKVLKGRKHQYFENLEKEKGQNLNLKKDIILKIKELTDKDITKEVSDQVKELQETWKKIGSVPKADADNLYKSYKALLDQFYAKKSMEHELIRLDREKNLVAKTTLCEKAEALIQEENINEAVAKLNILHQEYKTIGHIPREKQEEIWQRFKKASDEIYNKKRAYVEELKKSLEENMKVKQELCLKIESYSEYTSDQINEWNEKTKEVLQLQEAWDKIGPVPREVAKTINKQFWANFKSFFNNKHQFFEALGETRQANLKLKEELCEQVESVQDSFDWNEVANKVKELQQKWKDIGPVPQAQREEIYQRFKKACDHFFNRKRNRRAEQDKEFAHNQEKKTTISKSISELDPLISDVEKQLDELIESWFKVGFVPRENIATVQSDLTQAVENFLAKTTLSEELKEEKMFELQKQFLLASGNVKGGHNKKEQTIRRKITNIENDIALWKNNLEFFASSKTADKLRDEFNAKIEKADQELIKLKGQLKAFNQIRKQMQKSKESEKKKDTDKKATQEKNV